MQPVTHSLPTKAGHSIVARVFHSALATIKGVCTIAPATGVAQYLYDDFARWLNEQGYHVVTFDYDGIGLSLKGSIKQCKSDILSWANNDSVAVINFVEQQFPELEHIWIGHSVGIHVLGFMGHNPKIDRVISVAAGTGTWYYNAAPTRRVAWFLWYFLVPLTVPFCGYFPGDKLRVMCDLPKGVMYQWRRWCLHKDYAVGKEGDWLRQRFASVKTPITSVSFADDDMMSLKNVEHLHGFFSGTAVQRVHVKAQDVGVKRIGHVGWHRARYQTLWEKIIEPLLTNKSA